MKRAAIAWLVVPLVSIAGAQIRGVPASVTSPAPNRSFTSGPPASVTSLGPNGFGNPCSSNAPSLLTNAAMGCLPTQFTSGFFFHDGRDHGVVNLHPRHRARGFAPVYVPYAVPYAYPVVPAEAEQPAEEAVVPAPTIFENRPPMAARPLATANDYARYGTHYLDSRENPETAPMAASAPAQPPIVLIFRDGHQQEVANYAIVGQTLFDLGYFVAHKIPLSDLNLKATIKANDDRGVDFSVPNSVKID
ncbi:MAG: hypothetical protein ACR2IF_11235 [Terriglobales bacterium]